MDNLEKCSYFVCLSFYLLVAVLFGCLYQVSPSMLDDFWFKDGAKDLVNLNDKLLWLVNIIQERRLSDSWRFANLLGPFFLVLFPRFVFSLLTAGIVFVTLFISRKIITPISFSIRSWLLLAAYVFYLPWYDGILCIMFALNYVWATALTVTVIFLFFRAELCEVRRRKIMIAGVFGICFLTGWIHEGFSLPLICGCIASMVYTILCGERIGHVRIIMILMLMAGFGMVLSSPSFWHREGVAENKLLLMPFNELLMQLGPSLFAVIIYLVTLCLAILRRVPLYGKWQLYRVVRFEDVFFLGSIASALFVELMYFGGARLGWATELFAILATLRLWGEWNFRLRLPWRMLWILIIIVFIIFNLLSAIRLQLKLKREFYEIVALYEDSRDGTVYYDPIKPSIDWTLLKSSVLQFHQRIPCKMFSRYYNPDKSLNLLPRSISDFSVEIAKRSAYSDGVWIYNSHIIVRPTLLSDSQSIVTVVLKDKSLVDSRFRRNSFRGNDGNDYILIVPHVQVLNSEVEIKDAFFR